MKLFVREGNAIRSRLREFELALLRMVPQLIDTVGEPGIDRAADRLTPQVYADDSERSAEFRRLAGELIDDGRAEDVAALRDLVDAVEVGRSLTEEQAAGWMRAINHARLILGARLGIEEDGWEETSGVSMDQPQVVMLQLLTQIQADLIGALSSQP